MKTISLVASLILITACGTGCATAFRGYAKGPDWGITVYPATMADIVVGESAATGTGIVLEDVNNDFLTHYVYCPLQLLGAIVDVPISLVTDTLLLPYDLWTRKETIANRGK